MMIEVLDSFRDCLEDLGEELGVTDPVSGEAVLDFRLSKSTTKRKNTKNTVKQVKGRQGAPKKKAAKKSKGAKKRVRT